MKFVAKTLGLFVLLSSISCSNDNRSKTKEAPDEVNSPSIFGLNNKKKYTDIIKSAELDPAKLPWSDSYWPALKGGIANRWQNSLRSNDYRKFMYDPLAITTKLATMSQAELDALSPAEKYDIWQNDNKMSLTQYSIDNTKSIAQHYLSITGTEQVPDWEGLCDGWAHASIHEPQPTKVIQKKSSLIGLDKVINFYPSDINALSTQIYAKAPINFKFIGGRCNDEELNLVNGRVTNPECRDTNPASFLLALSQFIGENKKSIVMDITQTAQVWNHPIIGYETVFKNIRTAPLQPHFAPGTKKLVDVDLNVYYIGENAPNTTATKPLQQAIKFEFTLELDQSDTILGGEWISEDRPDFIWILEPSEQNKTILKDYTLEKTKLSYKWVKHLIDESIKPNIPDTPKNILSLSANQADYCAIDQQGLVCWGDRNRSIRAPELKNPSKVSLAKNHSCVLEQSGVVCWQATDSSRIPSPALNKPYQIATNSMATCALDSFGLNCWGEGVKNYKKIPLNNASELAMNEIGVCVIEQGQIKCWRNDGTTQRKLPMDQPKNLTAYEDRFCAADQKNIRCWGDSLSTIPASNTSILGIGAVGDCYFDQNGIQCTPERNWNPASIPTLNNPSMIAIGHSMCVLDKTGVRCFAENFRELNDVPRRLRLTN